MLVDEPVHRASGRPGGLDWNARDAGMAAQLQRHRAPGSAVLHCGGNLHTLVRPPADEPSLQPMGAVLGGAGEPVLSIRIDYRSGSYSNLGLHQFHDRPRPAQCLLEPHGDGLRFVLPTATPALPPRPQVISQ